MVPHLVVTDLWQEFGIVTQALSERGVDIVPHRAIGESVYPPLSGDDQDIYSMFLIDLPGAHGSTASLDAFGLRMAEALSAFAIDPVKTILVLHRNRSFTSVYTHQHLKAILDRLRQHFPNAPIFDTLDEALDWVATEFVRVPVPS